MTWWVLSIFADVMLFYKICLSKRALRPLTSIKTAKSCAKFKDTHRNIAIFSDDQAPLEAGLGLATGTRQKRLGLGTLRK